MTKIFHFSKDKFNLPLIILVVALIFGFFHFFSYLFPFTDNAFVVANIQTVAADVSGYVTDIYVKNGQHVVKNQTLLQVFKKPYQLAYEKAKAECEETIAAIEVLNEEINKYRNELAALKAKLAKVSYEYNLKKKQRVSQSVSKLTIEKLKYDVESHTYEANAIQDKLTITAKKIKQQQSHLVALKAKRDKAKVYLNLTTVRAGSDGIVDNMYLSRGTPVIAHKPLFSFINTDEWYVQANFNETDLRHVRPGDKVIILLRMYYFHKIFHGEIVNNIWVANRQTTYERTQQQVVTNNNEWLNLPQRFPLQIKITNPDPHYPLNPGASAYVYIRI